MSKLQVSDMLAQAFAAEGVDMLFTLMGDANMYWSVAMAAAARHEGRACPPRALRRGDGRRLRPRDRQGRRRLDDLRPGLHPDHDGADHRRARQRRRWWCSPAIRRSPPPGTCSRSTWRRSRSALGAHYVARQAHRPPARQRARGLPGRAQLERRPVVLSVPMDLQKQAWPHLTDYTPSADLVPTAQRPLPDPAIVDRVVDMIAEAEKPIIIAGRGAILLGRARRRWRRWPSSRGALLGDVAAGQGPVRGQSLRARHRRRLRQRLRARALRRSRPGDRRRRGARPLHDRGRLPLSRRAHRPDRHQPARPVAGPAHRRPARARRRHGRGRGDRGAPEGSAASRAPASAPPRWPSRSRATRPTARSSRSQPNTVDPRKAMLELDRVDSEGLGHRGRRRPLLQHRHDAHEGPAGRQVPRGQRFRRHRLGTAGRHRHRRGARRRQGAADRRRRQPADARPGAGDRSAARASAC